MKIIAPKSYNSCTIGLPPSKSVVNRAIVLYSLYRKSTKSAQEDNSVSIKDLLDQKYSGQPLCDDISVMQYLADNIDKTDTFSVQASGTAMRFGTALFAVTEGTRTITGTARLCERPIKPLVDALRQLGANIEYLKEDGYPPLKIHGNPQMKGGELSIRGDISSQFISALLMISPSTQNGIHLNIEGEQVSQSYINMTNEMIRRVIEMNETPELEPDWSAAAFWYEISTLCGVTFNLPGLKPDSVQGDKICDRIFKLVNEYKKEDGIFEYDFQDCPDLAQAVIVTCCVKQIPFKFIGLKTLKIKETDRIVALKTELQKLGYCLNISNETIEFDGKRNDRTNDTVSIETYKDHRMAMAFAPCAIKFGSINILDPDVVNKSYPTFWNDLQKAGFILS